MLTIFAKIDHFGQTNSDEHKTLKLIRILFEPKNPANGFEKKEITRKRTQQLVKRTH